MTCEKGCCLFGEEAQLLSKSEDCEIFRLSDESGEAKFTVYSVFPGISLIYKDIHASRFEPELFKNQKLLEINHCREGRAEFSFGEKLCYLSPGDISVIFEKERGREVSYPLKHYHGLSVVIDAKTGLATIDGANAFDKVDLWAFPVLKAGETALTFSDTNARVTIKYTPMWI